MQNLSTQIEVIGREFVNSVICYNYIRLMNKVLLNIQKPHISGGVITSHSLSSNTSKKERI